MAKHIVQLDPDHPGFRDPVYRSRRDTIARIANEHVTGSVVPHAPYTDEEHAVWITIQGHLRPLHEQLVSRDLLAMAKTLNLPSDRIPQLAEVNDRMNEDGFRMEPVAGLVSARDFLSTLADGVFCSTQYIRHASKPFYTPEPDVVHELVGHAATLLHPGVQATSRRFGAYAKVANDNEIIRLVRVYWYTLEFGLVREDGEIKAWGAGLLSSIGELQRAVSDPAVKRVSLNLNEMAKRPYDPTYFQDVYDVGEGGLKDTLTQLDEWLDGGHWRDR